LTNYPLYLRSTNIILGGHLNAISNAPSDNFAIILGGDDNFIGLATGVSVGGLQNAILDGANISSIVGGQANFIDTLAAASVIGGGYGNSISNAGEYDVIAGGNQNEIGLGAVYSVIPGGNQNYVGPSANYSFAAGDAAQALHNNTFVWSDGTVAPFASVNQRTFIINADNGVAIRTNDPAGNGLKVRGTIDATDGYLRDGQPVMNPGVYSYLRSTSPISTATNVEVTAYLLFETNNVIHWPIQSAFSIVFSNHTDTLSWSDDTAGRYEMRTLIVTAEGVTNIIQLDFRPRTNWIFQGQTTWFPPLNLAPDQTYTFTLRHIGGKTNVFISYETATNSLAPH
jgi:hypothetical protein